MLSGPCIDLFCGAGGLSCGFMQAGFEVRVGVDVDASALSTFQRNHPGAAAIQLDIIHLTGEILRAQAGTSLIFGIIGGPPCQGFSVAGKHDPDDPRNQLPYEYARLLEEVQPCFFLMENVKGLLTKKQRIHFEAILELFAAAGYKLKWKLLNAWDYGVAQTRERVFIVGFRHDLDVTFTWPEVDPSKPVLRDAIGDLPEPVGSTVVMNHTLHNPTPLSMQNRLRHSGMGVALFNCIIQDWDQPCKTITAHLAKDVDLAHPGTLVNHGPVLADSERMLQLISQSDDNGAIPLKTPKSAIPSGVGDLKHRQKKGASDNPNRTVTGQARVYAGSHGHAKVAQPRRFTVRECARIQSFPDDFVFTGSLHAQYRQVGNAVPPKLAYRLANQIAKAFQPFSEVSTNKQNQRRENLC